jgi:hypothetical protein
MNKRELGMGSVAHGLRYNCGFVNSDIARCSAIGYVIYSLNKLMILRELFNELIAGRIYSVNRVVPDVCIEIELIVIPNRIGLQEPPEGGRVGGIPGTLY